MGIRVPVAISDALSWSTLTMVTMSVEEMCDMASTTRAARKEDLPSFVYGRFGSQRSPKGSLRHDANLISRTGWAVDYDGEVMPFDEAKARMNAAGIVCFGFTSPSHTPNKPRWRLGGPFSREISAAEYPRMIARINGVLGGVVAPESFKITQCMFIGRVDGAAFDSFIGDGEELADEAEELDRSAIPLRRSKQAKTGKPDLKDLGEDELEEEIKTNRSPFHASGRLLWLWALQGISKEDAEANLEAIFDSIPQNARGPKWSAHRRAIPAWVDKMYLRASKHLGTFLAKLVAYLTEDPLWRGAIRLNQFTQTIEVCDPFPPQPARAIAAYRPLREIDPIETLLIVQAKGFPKAHSSDIWRALILIAERQGYHPLQDYLLAQEPLWDGTPRGHRLFFDAFAGWLPPQDNHVVVINGKPQPSAHDKWVRYYEETGLRWLISAVARALAPGCKVDCMPIFVSDQGYYKSLGLQALAVNPAWFTDDIPIDVGDKDAKDALVGKWICEFSEMPHAKRDVEKFKGFVSRQTDRFRRAYERLTQDWPRQNVFAGSSNELVYLDTTGNRRNWAIPLAAPVNVEWIEQNRDQLWAEAVHLYRSERRWWLDENTEKIAGEIQAGYAEDDAIDAPIEIWVERRRDPSTRRIAPFEMGELYPALRQELGLGTPLGLTSGPTLPSKADQNRIANCLKRLGFRRGREWVNGKQRKVWIERA
jgi:hypothetical protein